MSRLIFSLFLLVICALPLHAQSAAQEIAQGESAWSHDNYKAAATHFGRAVQASAGNTAINTEAFYGRGVARLQLQNWSGARDDLTRAIELNPKNAGAFEARGMARKALGDYDGLLLDAHEAARLDPAEFTSFEDDAKSTVVYRRMMLIFFGLACILLVIGGSFLGRSLIRLLRAEHAANRAAR